MVGLLISALSIGVVAAAGAPLPDLVVKKITVQRPADKKSTKVTLVYVIANQGNAASPASAAQLTVNDRRSVKQTPPLKPGESVTTTLTYDLAKTGKHWVKVSADYNNRIRESNERNNTNTIRFSIGN
ncbi:MAG TPA: CARDB domain-containing protein [Candidatus Sulfotelmatobacter sp.]|nr:CARDB domain-containing protein [Candidatus Sulfotelmatobacter sp.]